MSYTPPQLQCVTAENVVNLLTNEMINQIIMGLQLVYDHLKPSMQAQPYPAVSS